MKLMERHTIAQDFLILTRAKKRLLQLSRSTDLETLYVEWARVGQPAWSLPDWQSVVM